MTIGEKIRELRQSQEMTLEQVGRGAGLSRQRIHGLETSDTIPTIPTLMQVAKALHCTLLDIIGEPLGLEIEPAKKQETKPCANAGECPFFKKGE